MYLNSQRISALVLTLALALASVVSARAEVIAGPFGKVVLTVPGLEVGATTAFSFRSLGLARVEGSTDTITALTANTITAGAARWTEDQFNGASGAYYVEILGAAGAAGVGTTYDISDTAAATKVLTLAQNLAPGVAVGQQIAIRKHWTLADLLGASNEAGLQSGTETTADLVSLYYNGAYASFYYLAGQGWRKVGDATTDQATQVIYPDDGLLFTRRSSGVKKIAVLGAVRMGQTSFPILPGMNLMANPYGVPMTLASSGLYTGSATTGLAAGFASTADQVLIYNGTSYDTYYYSTGGLPGTGWRKVGGGKTNAAGTLLPSGGSFIIQRQQNTGFDWVSPPHPQVSAQ